MAQFKVYAPFLSSWEGGYSNNKNDSGGETYRGITIAVWQNYCKKKGLSTPLKKMTQAQWEEIMKGGYWDVLRCDDIASQSVANQVADFGVNAGTNRAAKKLQEAINAANHDNALKVDGVVGAKTIAAANALHPSTLYWTYRELRTEYYKSRAALSPKNATFLKGWLRRVNALGYGKYNLNDLRGSEITFK